MNVSGRVLLRGSNTRISRLLVTVYDADTNVTPSNLSSCDCSDFNWVRLGSAVTDSNGGFDLSYGSDGKDENSRYQPNLVLVVSKTEENAVPGREKQSPLATVVRRKAASAERFFIALEQDQLTSAGIPLPKEDQDIEDLIARRRAASHCWPPSRSFRISERIVFAETHGTRTSFSLRLQMQRRRQGHRNPKRDSAIAQA
jgi:hypothetical protein